MTQDAPEPNKTSATGINLLKLAKNRKFSDLEAEWMKALDSAPSQWADLFEVPEYLVRSNEVEQAVLLLWALVAAAREKLPPGEALALGRRAAQLAPTDGSLRGELAELYVLAYESIPEIKTLVKNSGLQGETPADLAIERMERFLRLRPGTYVRETKTRKIGRVDAIESDGFVVNIDGAPQNYTPSDTDSLEILEPDDLRALAAFEPERIAHLRESDPAEVIRLALKTFGGRLEFRQLKERLTTGVIPPGAWSAWWTKAREAAKRSPVIEMTDDAQPYLVLRRTALNYEERVRRRLQAAPSLADQFDVILEYLRSTQAGQPAEKAVTQHLANFLKNVAAKQRDGAPILCLAALALLGEFRRRFPDADVASGVGLDTVLSKIPDFAHIPTEIRSEEIQLLILAVIKDNFADLWPEIYAKILPGCSVRMCDLMARELTAGEKSRALSTAIATIVRQPEAHPEAFIWLWKTACSGYPASPFQGLQPVNLTVTLLSLGNWAANLNRPGDRAQARALITQIRHAVAANDYRIFRSVVHKASPDEARHLREALDQNRFLSDVARNDLIGILSSAHHDLFVEVKKPWEEPVIYTTRAGLDKRQKELERIVNVELPKVAEAIGRAIGFGDVSDNAEYRAGLEQRDNLSKRAAAIRQEIASARLITREMITGDEVTVGAMVKAKNLATGEVETFAFLGPWDADIPRRIYSYLAPFSLAFMGKRRGETVTVSGPDGPRRFEILEIAPAI